MAHGKITYCVIDVTDKRDVFECEGRVIKSFFKTSPVFNSSKSISIIQSKVNIISKIRNSWHDFFNILHIAAHGKYFKKTKENLDYATIYSKKGGSIVEVFRPETLVRLRLKADVFLTTSCESFNKSFIEVIKGYSGIDNFIAPKDSPLIGDTTVFSLMFYNEMIRLIRRSHLEISDKAIIDSFKTANKAYKTYKGEGNFALYNKEQNKIFE